VAIVALLRPAADRELIADLHRFRAAGHPPRVTDIPSVDSSLPGRFALAARVDGDGGLRLTLDTQPEVLRHGVVRASVLAYVIDAAAGITVDEDPDVWTLTTDLSLRMRPVPAPARVEAVTTIVRRGRRSVTSVVDLVDEHGRTFGLTTIGFASVPRKDGDPPKPMVTPEVAARLFSGQSRLTEPLVEASGIQVLDAAAGVVEVPVTPELRNPAGTMQGAMVALVAEVAAEELAATRTDRSVVVTDLDVRYLAQAPNGPIRTLCRPLGPAADDPVEVRLVDTSFDRLTTVVYARAREVPA
jgi:acyl-coenzyme A thioesterase PaaI-like protein